MFRQRRVLKVQTSFKRLLIGLACASFSLSVDSATYSGNGNADFGGAIGGGTLTLTDNGTNITGTVTRGKGTFNDVLVIYIDSVPGGFTDTAGFADDADGLRKAISGFSSATNRSTLTFNQGFLPDYAIALGPASDNFGGLWRLANGQNNSLEFKNSVNLNPSGPNNAPSYTFSFKFSDIGLTSAQGFKLFGTYVSNTGYRSGEAIAGNVRGPAGWSSFAQLTNAAYGTADTENNSSNAPSVEPAVQTGTSSADEKQLCAKNLSRIDAAIRAYREQNKELPHWLSDLVPDYLDDINILICPVTRRTGQLQNFGLADPKLATSYIYEFCSAPVPQSIGGDGRITMREWKQRQMVLAGDIVPIVRCHLHNPLLNLSFGGKVYESPATWEGLVTNQVNAAELSIGSLLGKPGQ